MFEETEISDYSEDYGYLMLDDNIDDIEYDLIYLEHTIGIIQEIGQNYNIETEKLIEEMNNFIKRID